jgi:hypothetical protein
VLLEAFHSLREPGLDNAGSKVVPQSPVRRQSAAYPRQSIVVAAMLAYSRQVANTQNIIPQQILLLFWKGEQRFAQRGAQEFTAGHAVILVMNSVFENSDRSGFRDSMSSLILDRWRWLTTPNP